MGAGFLRCIATVCLILGLLKFAKDAPELMKTLFSNGGNLFAGMNLKPGVKKRIQENDYAMKGIGGVNGAVAGTIGAGAAAYKNYLKNHGKGDGEFSLGAIGKTAISIPRGIVSGGRAGLKNAPTEFTYSSIKDSAFGSTQAAQTSRNKVDNRQHKVPFVQGAYDLKDAFIDEVKDWKENFGGQNNVGDIVKTINSKYSSDIETVFKRAKTEDIQKACDELVKDFRKNKPVPLTDSSGVTHNASSIKEIEDFYKRQKYEAVQQTFSKNDDSAKQFASYFSLISKNMAHDLGSLSQANIDALNSKIVNCSNSGIKDIQAFMNHFSDPANMKNFTTADAKIFMDLQSTFSAQVKDFDTSQALGPSKTKPEKKDDKK